MNHPSLLSRVSNHAGPSYLLSRIQTVLRRRVRSRHHIAANIIRVELGASDAATLSSCLLRTKKMRLIHTTHAAIWESSTSDVTGVKLGHFRTTKKIE